MAGRLTQAIEGVLALPQRPERILLAGDCAHLTGGRGDYHEFARRIGPLVAANLPLHITLGNHDSRERFWETLPREQPVAPTALPRQAMVVPGRYADWFLLDSLDSTDKGPGELGKEQLDWLAAELDSRPDRPALLMLHHDPPCNGAGGSLNDSDALLTIVRPRRQVKALFFGHTHIWFTTQDSSGIHLVNLPATGYTLWWRSFIGWVDCLVQKDGAILQVHALNPKEKEHGQVVRLKWRDPVSHMAAAPVLHHAQRATASYG
jgi:3',5'-cyclic AMP phosphodiesterase CpdA